MMALFLAVMTIITFTQVVLRYLFDGGFTWSLEATTYSFAWLILIGMSYGVRTGAHIAMDLVRRRLPARLSTLAGLTAVVLCLCYALLMTYGAGVFVWRMFLLGHMAHDLPVARWLLTAMMPIGFALLCVRFIQVGLQAIKTGVVNLGARDIDTDGEVP